jgi:predicted metal-dependent phosphoesterase TrpH
MIKLDLHTHSLASPDGGIRAEQYTDILEQNLLDIIAVTDHNILDVARELHATYPDKIIVGEEIMTTDGEIIGLYLQQVVMPGQSPAATVRAIKEQGGIVYIPHPFETVRSGITKAALESIISDVDIIEIFNGRAVLQNKGAEAVMAAKLNHHRMAASSDAHTIRGVGTAYTLIENRPTTETLLTELENAQYVTKHPPLHTLLAPKFNRLRKRFGGVRA